MKTRLEAAYALGTLGSPAMGPMDEATATAVAADLAATLLDPDRPTRQVVARVAGRVFAPHEGRTVPASIGDALINSMNDGDPLVRRWAMDSLGWLRYDRAVQSLTDRASYYGKSEEGSAALHGLARIASPASGPVFRALLASSAPTFRVISIEGLAPDRRSVRVPRHRGIGDQRQAGQRHAWPRTWRRSCWRRRPT